MYRHCAAAVLASLVALSLVACSSSGSTHAAKANSSASRAATSWIDAAGETLTLVTTDADYFSQAGVDPRDACFSIKEEAPGFGRLTAPPDPTAAEYFRDARTAFAHTLADCTAEQYPKAVSDAGDVSADIAFARAEVGRLVS